MFLRLYMDSQIVPVYDSMGFIAHYSFNFALASIWKIIVFTCWNHGAVVLSRSDRIIYQQSHSGPNRRYPDLWIVLSAKTLSCSTSAPVVLAFGPCAFIIFHRSCYYPYNYSSEFWSTTHQLCPLTFVDYGRYSGKAFLMLFTVPNQV